MSITLLIGYDSPYDEVWQVAAHSARTRASVPLTILPIKIDELKAAGMYHRAYEKRGKDLWDVISDAPMSTEFAISRFFVPHLAKTDWAVFCDIDFLWQADIAELMRLVNPDFALQCVQHNHEKPETAKMNGVTQTQYNRKNWSSLMLWNLKHPAHQKLTIKQLNTLPGRDFHRFYWLEDHEIGALPPEWNYLVGVSDPSIKPKVIHYTLGGPWLEGYEDCQYADLWLAERAAYRAAK